MEFPKDAVEQVVKVRPGDDPPLGAERATANARDRAVLARAAETARSGHYDAAWSLVEEISRDSSLRTEALDLRARILAQQGRYAEAERYWAEALRLSPGNPDCARALDALAQERRHPVWVRPVVAVGLAMLVLAAAACVAGVPTFWMAGRYDALAKQVEALANDARAQHEATARMLEAVQERLERIESKPSGPAEPPGPLGKAVGQVDGVGIGTPIRAADGRRVFWGLFRDDMVQPRTESLADRGNRPDQR